MRGANESGKGNNHSTVEDININRWDEKTLQCAVFESIELESN